MKTMETFWASLETLLVEQHAREIKKDKRLCLVKIFLLKNDNFDLALRKRLFCTVKVWWWCGEKTNAGFWNAKQ